MKKAKGLYAKVEHDAIFKPRVAKRGLKIDSNVKYSCIKSMAELEENIDGSLSIKKLILE